MSLDCLRFRAELFELIRLYFKTQSVLEVETPILSSFTTTDPFIESFEVLSSDSENQNLFLHTSPEFHMKRLLALYKQDIYQIEKVFRKEEQGIRHHREFSLLEWYRVGYDEQALIEDISCLFQFLFKKQNKNLSIEKISYKACFYRQFKLNPHQASVEELRQCAENKGLISLDDGLQELLGEEKDRWLDLLMSCVIDPGLGGTQDKPILTFVYDYPQTQAALARIDFNKEQEKVAKRFEVYLAGMELGNGFHELNDSKEQRKRFEAENSYRQAKGKKLIPLDEVFLNSLDELPNCSGVAIGLDRLMMVLLEESDIKDVLTV